jgi:predicted methyltransferase
MGVDILYTVLSSLPSIPKSVFDRCVGLGTTAKVCKKIGAVCYANELNPKRAAKTMKILDFEFIGK